MNRRRRVGLRAPPLWSSRPSRRNPRSSAVDASHRGSRDDNPQCRCTCHSDRVVEGGRHVVRAVRGVMSTLTVDRGAVTEVSPIAHQGVRSG